MLQGEKWAPEAESLGSEPCAGRFRSGPQRRNATVHQLHFPIVGITHSTHTLRCDPFCDAGEVTAIVGDQGGTVPGLRVESSGAMFESKIVLTIAGAVQRPMGIAKARRSSNVSDRNALCGPGIDLNF